MNRRARIVLATALAAAAGCGHSHSGWVASESRHTTVYTDRQYQHLFTQEWLETSLAAYRALFPNATVDSVEVLWLRDRGLPGRGLTFYSPFGPDPADRGLDGGAWALELLPSGGRIGKQGLIVLETRDPRAAAIQLAHLFIARTIPNAPLWLQVGLAKYMAKHRIHYNKDHWMVCFGSPVFDEPVDLTERMPPLFRARQEALDDFSGGAASLLGTSLADAPIAGFATDNRAIASKIQGNEVMVSGASLFENAWYRYDKKLRYWYEYSSYALVHYMIHGRHGFHRQRFAQFLHALGGGMPADQAIALAYPHILDDEWDEELAAYVRPPMGKANIAKMQTIAQGLCLPVPPLDYAEDRPRRTPVSPADIGTVLADLERLPLDKRLPFWWPADVIRTEIEMQRGGGRPREREREGSGAGQPVDRGGVPSVTKQLPAPAPQATPPQPPTPPEAPPPPPPDAPPPGAPEAPPPPPPPPPPDPSP